jgi:hypothetical protein
MQEAIVVWRETHIPAPPAAVFALLIGWVRTDEPSDKPSLYWAGGREPKLHLAVFTAHCRNGQS